MHVKPVQHSSVSCCHDVPTAVPRYNSSWPARHGRIAAARHVYPVGVLQRTTRYASKALSTVQHSNMAPADWRRPYTPGPLTPEECEQYWQDGYIIKKGLLKVADLRQALQAIDRRVDEVACNLHAAGLITDPCSSCDVWTRLTQLEKQYPEAGVLVHKDGRLPPEFAALWSHPTLLDMAQQLLGPDVGGHPSWNVRAKTPRQSAGDVPWHQDSAYCTPDSWTTLQVTAWIPLLDVTAAHGCMQLLRGGHRAGKTAPHIGAYGNTWHVYMDEAAAVQELGVDFTRDVVTADMKAGDVLIFNNLTPHRSLDNTSSVIRWSLDFRWQHPEQPDGAYGLKRSIRLTQPGNPDYVIPWAGWADVDKKTGAAARKQQDSIADAATTDTAGAPANDPGTAAAVAPADSCNANSTELALNDPDCPLSTVLVGPWLDLWPITHQNKHTRAWQEKKQQQQQPVKST